MFCIGIHLEKWIWLSGIIYPNLSEGKMSAFFVRLVASVIVGTVKGTDYRMHAGYNYIGRKAGI